MGFPGFYLKLPGKSVGFPGFYLKLPGKTVGFPGFSSQIHVPGEELVESYFPGTPLRNGKSDPWRSGGFHGSCYYESAPVGAP